jgi:ABC-2 type transport system ATP-binding protein
MEEAEYCDRSRIQDAGTMLAIGTPDEVRQQASDAGHPVTTMEEAFIAIVEKSRDQARAKDAA